MKSGLLVSALALAAGITSAAAEDVTIGMIEPMTGPSASTGKQDKAGAELYIAAARRHRRRQENQRSSSRTTPARPTSPSASRRNWSPTTTPTC